MKKEFFAHIKPTEVEFKNLWENCIFTLDTNILLNFYRYKSETTTEFLSLLEKLRDRTILTYQASLEYFDERLVVISEQEKTYSDLSKAFFKEIEEPLSHQRKHPYISPELLEKLTELGKEIKADLSERSREHTKRYSDDDIMNKIVVFFTDKVETNFTAEELKSIYEEGEKRYESKIPPGYEDKKKNGNNKYGDLVLWKQMINMSNKNQKDIIFITDDQKEDWWHIHGGKTISPHPLLQDEFFKNTSKRIYFYTAERFYQFASEFLREEVKQDILNEVRDVREEEVSKNEKNTLTSPKINPYFSYEVVTEEELLKQLKFFKEHILAGGYVGLKKFITEYLAEQDFEINHSYAIINNLVQNGKIKIFSHYDEKLNYNVKVVEIIE
jgi:PIN like domain